MLPARVLECVPDLGKGALLIAVSSAAATPLAIAGAIVAGVDIPQCMSDDMVTVRERAPQRPECAR